MSKNMTKSQFNTLLQKHQDLFRDYVFANEKEINETIKSKHLVKSLIWYKKIINSRIKDEDDKVNLFDERIEIYELHKDVFFEYDIRIEEQRINGKRQYIWTLVFKEPDNQFDGDEVCIWDYKDPLKKVVLLTTNKLPAFITFEDLDKNALDEFDKYLQQFENYKSIINENEDFEIVDIYEQLYKTIIDGIKDFIYDLRYDLIDIINIYHSNKNIKWEYFDNDIFYSQKTMNLIEQKKLNVL